MMQQFVVIAEDGDDEAALPRRMSARPSHFDMARKLKAENHFITGGATLDPNGHMNGSVMIVQFETEEALRNWLSEEPYVTGKVWKNYIIKPFRVAEV